MDSASSVSTSPSSAPRSPISTPSTTPPASPAAAAAAAAAAPEPTAAPLPLCQERPAPGTFMFLPTGAPWMNESPDVEGGDPTGHPVLILPATNGDPEMARFLFTTTKDIMENCKARSWGENYLPLGNQEHPWREPVALCGSFPRPTSLNITSKYKVPWRCLESLAVNSPGVPAPCLSPQGLEKVNEFVNCSHIDKDIPWIRNRAVKNTRTRWSNQAPVTPAKRDDSVSFTFGPAAPEHMPRPYSYPAHINQPWRLNL
ncbi:hypothetical protein KCU91_g1245, partial [Aureobasidium melanogenum]